MSAGFLFCAITAKRHRNTKTESEQFRKAGRRTADFADDRGQEVN
jgi:hypothetical protein